ncbi:hypothetical protein J6590_070016 [Homalodisca vitripennis]|nr:hypothetical protein J6590_070016 [Homalodisca vitripennis]
MQSVKRWLTRKTSAHTWNADYGGNDMTQRWKNSLEIIEKLCSSLVKKLHIQVAQQNLPQISQATNIFNANIYVEKSDKSELKIAPHIQNHTTSSTSQLRRPIATMKCVARHIENIRGNVRR